MRRLYIIVSLLLCAALGMPALSDNTHAAHQLSLKEKNTIGVRFNAVRLDKEALLLDIDIDVKLNYIYVNRSESLQLSLALRSADNKQTLALPPIIINGANRWQMYKRAVVLKGESLANNGAYAVVKCDADLIQLVPYRIQIAYHEWMRNAQLVLFSERKTMTTAPQKPFLS